LSLNSRDHVMENNDAEVLEALEQLGYDVAQVCKNGHLINEIA